MPKLHFSLRTLLVGMALVAFALSWYVDRLRQPEHVVLHLAGSQAMAPTLTNQYLVADLNAYRFAKPVRWHAVVLNPHLGPGLAYAGDVLRVVGLPGETVAISDGGILIDGEPLALPPQLQYIRYHLNVPGGQALLHPYTVPVGHYYLLGDNPDAARDSRLLGAFPQSSIRGLIPNR